MIDVLSCIHYNRGLQHARAGRLGEAIKSLAGAMSYDPGNVEAWNLVGLCYYRLGLYAMAGQCWGGSVERKRDANPAAAYLVKLRTALEQGKPLFSQVEVLTSRREYTRAAQVLEGDILPLFGPSEMLLCKLGLLKALQGKRDQAVQCWKQALAVNADSEDAGRYLAEMAVRPLSRLNNLKKKLARVFYRPSPGSNLS